LYACGNVEELSEKIDTLFKDKKLTEKLSKNAKEFAKYEFSKERYYQEILDIYNSLGREEK